MLASAITAENGNDVTLIEKNEKLGKKLYVTGKGRCNVTNDCTAQKFLENVVTNSKFLNGAIYAFPPESMMDLLESEGLRLTVERGNRVFPSSNKSSDVIKVLQQKCSRAGVKIQLNCNVLSVYKRENVFIVKTSSGDFSADKVIIATGGVTYPSTGSTGDGYAIAKSFGHSIERPLPSLCGITVKENFINELEGLSLKNVNLSILNGTKTVFSDFGEMLFTSNGISGPIVLSASANINKLIFNKVSLTASIDLKPALSDNELDARVLSDFSANSNKAYKNSLDGLLPKKLIPLIIKLSEIDPDTKINQIVAEKRKKLVFLLKNLRFSVKSLDDIKNAVVTSGGVSVKEINPKTMESKLVDGLYFIGEVIDVDALTGGFNLQIDFSTAYAAAKNI